MTGRTTALVVLLAIGACGRIDASPEPATPTEDAAVADAGVDVDARTSVADAARADEGPFDSLAGCDHWTATPLLTPAALELVVDGALSADLGEAVDAFAAMADPDLAVGMIVFADSLDPNEASDAGIASYPTAVDVPLAAVDGSHAGALRARLGGGAGTRVRLGRALSGGYQVMHAASATTKAVVLVTQRTTSPGSALDEAAGALAPDAGAPVKTSVIGLGPFRTTDTNAYDPDLLGQLAVAGGTARAGCSPTAPVNLNAACYTQLSPTQPRATTIRDLLLGTAGALRGRCEYALPAEVTKPDNVNVFFQTSDGHKHVIAEDESDGWSFDDPTHPSRIVMRGQSCFDLGADPFVTVSVVEGCVVYVP